MNPNVLFGMLGLSLDDTRDFLTKIYREFLQVKQDIADIKQALNINPKEDIKHE